MSYPYFTKGLAVGRESVPAHSIPTIDRKGIDDPRAYIPHPDLAHAVNVALVLGMPLLLTGEPGTGKTQLASVIQHELKAPLYKFETKSTSQARDLFYTYDALTAFKIKDKVDPRNFVQFQALGYAILEAFPIEEKSVSWFLEPYISNGYRHRGPRRSVVLIDEIDKAPRDFSNDLLNEIDRLFFRVPELGNLGTPGADDGQAGIPAHLKPIIIITSNSEKGLPDAFLRRCIYFDIPFPTEAEMLEIVASRIAGLTTSDPLMTDALNLFYRLRHKAGETNLKKEPSTAELLSWLQVLIHRGAKPGQSLKQQKPLVLETLTTLVKNADDHRDAQEFVRDRWA